MVIPKLLKAARLKSRRLISDNRDWTPQ